MDPLTIILSALAAGAAAGVTEVAGSAIKDSYNALVNLISSKLKNDLKANSSLDGYLSDPETWEKPMKKTLQDAKIDADEEVLFIARQLLEILSLQSGSSKYNVEIKGEVQGFVQGDDAKVTMNFNKPLPAPKSKKRDKKGK